MKYFILYLASILLTANVFAQSNPMFSTQEVFKDTLSQTNSISVTNKDLENDTFQFSLFNKFIKKNASFQKEIKNRLAILAQDYNNTGSISAIFLIFLFAFLYGILHSLGPGHGKVFIFSYILTEKPKVLKAITLSYLIALVHAISGLVVALILIFVLNEYSTSLFSTSNSQTIISRFSYAILILLGLYIAIKTILKKEHSHNINTNKTDKIKLLPFIASIGFVPCPGTIIIVTFLASIGLFSIGIASVIFIVLGMGFTISLIGLISIFSKQLLLKIGTSDQKVKQNLYNYISIFGSILLVIFGSLFFIGTL